jgi:hypothetical protein
MDVCSSSVILNNVSRRSESGQVLWVVTLSLLCCYCILLLCSVSVFCQCVGQLRYAECITCRCRSVEVSGLHRRYFSYVLYREYNLLRFWTETCCVFNEWVKHKNNTRFILCVCVCVCVCVWIFCSLCPWWVVRILACTCIYYYYYYYYYYRKYVLWNRDGAVKVGLISRTDYYCVIQFTVTLRYVTL